MASNLQLVEDTFSAMGEATILLSTSGMVVHASDLARSLLGNLHGLSVKQGKLWHPSAAVLDNLSKAVVTTLETGQRSRTTVPLEWGETLTLDMTVAHPRIHLSEAPLVFVRIRRNSALNGADVGNLITAFSISRAEAKVLAGLVAGLMPSECAIQNGVRESTVRTQIANLKRKMQCSRIVDLVKLALLA
ncbi:MULTISPECIES: LuxR C-terminal-related transcriptional regulator [unclassified Burkholderia]|uniref:helix-turn-helix transcriptional regulator n=1 Tax=unclassified Burkholderia TaxID=2613784 RepID=UPI00075E9FF0|nr:MULTISPECIES: LuxR C-terminal-related transcriptional regulator [unclassified Burkholderia]KVN03515.1 LuxR family transcriptional regulator [Burkholderia sp. MSMB1552]KWZ55947.1 LuxR family transcriptional regulator [Burkholderia sp. MSMB1588]